MKLKDLLHIYYNTLDSIYSKEEINVFFYMLTTAYANIDKLELALHPDLVITKKEQNLFFNALERLKQHEPIQYIIGKTQFCNLPFKVNKHTLIPRPETEELVNLIVNDFNEGLKIKNDELGFKNDKNPTPNTQHPTPNTYNILDIGTGSGCIAIALAKIVPQVNVYALDVSKEALKIAKQNAKLNNVEIKYVQANILNSEFRIQNLEFDIIVSNPPYVRMQEKNLMQPNVLNYEPESALFVDDENPLLFYKAITQFTVKNLKPNGCLYVEINEYLGQQTKALIEQLDFNKVHLFKDAFGKDRFIKAQKK